MPKQKRVNRPHEHQPQQTSLLHTTPLQNSGFLTINKNFFNHLSCDKKKHTIIQNKTKIILNSSLNVSMWSEISQHIIDSFKHNTAKKVKPLQV